MGEAGDDNVILERINGNLPVHFHHERRSPTAFKINLACSKPEIDVDLSGTYLPR